MHKLLRFLSVDHLHALHYQTYYIFCLELLFDAFFLIPQKSNSISYKSSFLSSPFAFLRFLNVKLIGAHEVWCLFIECQVKSSLLKHHPGGTSLKCRLLACLECKACALRDIKLWYSHSSELIRVLWYYMLLLPPVHAPQLL